MNSNAWKGKAIVSYAIVAALLVTAIFIAIFSSSPSNGNATPKDLTSQQQAAQKQLTVDGSLTTGDGLFDCNSVTQTVGLSNGTKTPVFSVGAEAPVGQRLWSDAVNTPLNPQTLAAEQAVVCHEPAQAGMVMNGLGAQKVGDITVASLNSWMKAQGSPRVISQWAQGCMSKTDIQVHLQCARTMSLAATLLGRFHVDGVQKSLTAWNYHLAGGSLVVGKVPMFELNPKQYTGYFLSLSVTAKTGGCFVHVGFNVGTSSPNGGDQRLAGMYCVPPPISISPPKAPSSPGSTPPNKHSTPPGTTPAGTTPPGTPSSTTPGSTPPSTPQPSCTPTPGVESCGKHASYAPSPTGGPVVAPPSGGYIDRSGQPHSSAYVPPPPPASSSPNQGQSSAGSGATNTVAPPSASYTAPAPQPSATNTSTVPSP